MKEHWKKENLQKVILESSNRREVLLKMNIRASGSNFSTLNKYIDLYKISIVHFKKNYEKIALIGKNRKINIKEILIENSNYCRTHLKERLYKEGYLLPICVLCGQDENWNGMKISLILDHINGVYNDNRIENLRIVCPNCNAGLDTFAGRNNKTERKKYLCECGNEKIKKSKNCRKCASNLRKIYTRPPIQQLLNEVSILGYREVGRIYGVSDNTIRKWIKYSTHL